MEYSIKEAVTQLGVSRQAIHKKIKQLGLKPRRCGNRFFLSREQLDKIIATSTKKSHSTVTKTLDYVIRPKLSLIAAKYAIPPIPEDLVDRPRLTRKLNNSERFRLTLVTGPPGSGKTTLLNHWVRQYKKDVAWINLDRTDNDPFYFFSYLVVAIDKIQPDLKLPLLLEFLHLKNLTYTPFISELVNKFKLLSDEITIILDNFHTIKNDGIQKALSFLISHLPSNVHIFITGRNRSLPGLSRIGINNQLLEINATDLRFKRKEIEQYIKKVSNLEVSQKQISLLEKQTEGWITGLRVDCSSKRNQNDTGSMLNNFTGDFSKISDYFLEEIFQKQGKEVQNFLLETSILQKLEGDLCDTVTERTDSREMIRNMEMQNLFLTLDEESPNVYRYHYLFAKWLRHRLLMVESTRIHELHNRACEWHLQRNNYVNGIYHALEARNYSLATRLIEKECVPILLRDDVSTIKKWLEALPLEFLKSSHQLRLACAWVLYHKQGYEQVSLELNALQKEVIEDSDQMDRSKIKRISGEIALFGAILAHSQGHYSQAIRRCKETLENLSEHKVPIQPEIGFILGDSHFLNGNLERSSNIWQTLKQSQSSNLPNRIYDLISYRTFRLYFLKGELNQIGQIVRRSLKLQDEDCKKRGISAIVLGQLCYERNQLEKAERYLGEGIELTVQGRPWLVLYAFITLARLHLARGDQNEANNAVEKARHYAEMSPDVLSKRIVQAWNSRILLASGNETEAELAANQFQLPSEKLDYAHEIESLSWVRLYLFQNKFEEANEILNRLYDASVSKGKKGRVIEILALRALAFYKQGENEKALDALESSTQFAEKEGYSRVYLDEGEEMKCLLFDLADRVQTESKENSNLITYLRNLVSNYHESTDDIKDTSNYPVLYKQDGLTPRESEVLKMMAKGLSNKEIANGLYIATCTVKKHVNRIFDKLSAERRTMAVYQAKRFNLL